MNLAERLRSYGLRVGEFPGWETRTNKDRDRVTTLGILNHFDANKGTPDLTHYLHDNRFNGLLYHILIRRDGFVNLLGQRYAYHAGLGDARVRDDMRQNIPPRQGTRKDANGNPYFFAISINHHPDFEAIPQAQFEALLKANAAVADHYGLGKNQIADHATWTNRKVDIKSIHWPVFREQVARLRLSQGGDDMQFLIDTLKRLDTGFFQALQAKTGVPGGDPAYWGGNSATDAEWQAAAPTFMAAILTAAVAPAGGGKSASDIRKIIADAINNG